MSPVMVSLGARFSLGERLEDLHAGDLLNLVTLAGWSAFTMYGKRVLVSYTSAMVTTGAYLAGTLLIIPTAIAPPRPGRPFAPAARTLN